jgi:hypothetical protein
LSYLQLLGASDLIGRTTHTPRDNDDVDDTATEFCTTVSSTRIKHKLQFSPLAKSKIGKNFGIIYF